MSEIAYQVVVFRLHDCSCPPCWSILEQAQLIKLSCISCFALGLIGKYVSLPGNSEDCFTYIISYIQQVMVVMFPNSYSTDTN